MKPSDGSWVHVSGPGTKGERGAARQGVPRALTLAGGIAPMGILFGAAAATAGIPPSAAVVMSALVFAGGAQFAAIGLVSSGAAAATVIGVVLIINARYFLLSAATLDLARASGARWWERVLLALGVVDESFALQAAWAKGRAVAVAGLLAIPATLWVVWVLTTLAGAYVGGALPDLEPFGIDYVLPGIYVGLLGIFADTRPKRLRREGWRPWSFFVKAWPRPERYSQSAPLRWAGVKP